MDKRAVILIGIIVLASLLIVGGSYLYRQVSKNNQQQGSSGSGESLENMATTLDSTNSAKLPALPASPSAKQVDEYVENVREMAQESDTLVMDNCIATPNIFKVKQGADFKIQNNDDKQITVAISPKATYQVAAKKTVSVKMTASAAIYKYNCIYNGETSYKQAGVIEVAK